MWIKVLSHRYGSNNIQKKTLWKIPVGDAGIDQWPLYKVAWKKIFSFFIGNKKDPTQICICQSWKKRNSLVVTCFPEGNHVKSIVCADNL